MSTTLAASSAAERRLIEHVDRLAVEHPPIDLDSVDYAVRNPVEFEARFGHVLDYMARVELEVDRNVLELTTMLPDPPEIDRVFYADVWQPQEIRHGLILDALQVHLGRQPADADLDSLGLKLKVLGALSHLGVFQDVCRMLYYLTGMATERSAVLAYNFLHDGVMQMGETGDRQDGDRPDPPPGARPLRVLPAVRARPVGRAGRLAAVDGPADAPRSRSRPSAPTTTSRRPTSAT